MQVEIRNRVSGAVIYAAEIPDDTPSELRMRIALEKANEAHADLADAYLAGANLAGANLAHADLAGANLTGATWQDGIVIDKTPIQLYGLTWPVMILVGAREAHMQIGCELHSLAEWAEFDDARICSMDRQALRFWRAHGDAILALARGAGRHSDAKATGSSS